MGRSDLQQRQTWMREKHAVVALPRTQEVITSSAERHYAPAEVAAIWGLSIDRVRRLFGYEPGVLVIDSGRLTANKRRYTTLRIPQSVLDRVHRRLSIASGRVELC
jgi:hypothetical protein